MTGHERPDVSGTSQVVILVMTNHDRSRLVSRLVMNLVATQSFIHYRHDSIHHDRFDRNYSVAHK